jgi:2-succinyl-6-hydroxy-2,4-cyclohexadiene-1-carboxylate synthase
MKNPIWILPGFLGDETQLGEFPETLAQNTGVACEVINWSNYVEGANSIHQAGQFLAQFAMAHGTRPVLVGYSMGGRLALSSTIEAPGAYSAVIAISAHPGLKSEEEKNGRLEQDLRWAKLLVKDQARFWSEWNQQSVFSNSTPTTLTLSENEQQRWANLLVALSTATQNDLSEALSNKHLPPILHIAGLLDAKYLELQKDLPANIEKKQIKGSHRLPLDNPIELAQVIAPFIRSSQETL